MSNSEGKPKYPGVRDALDGNSAVIMCERESTDAAGAYPITPSTQMGEYWAEETAKGHINISGRPLIFVEPEGEHAAAAVTAGMSMTGLRAANFSSGQGIAYMHESLYAAVGKRLTYILNIGARAITKTTLNVHAGHDDYHCVDDTGFFQVFGKNAQEVCDLNIIAHKIAELALTPGIVAQDGFLTTHLIESMAVPERELIAEYLGRPEDMIDTPTPAQRILYGEKRRRIPEIWTVDNPMMVGIVQNQDSYMQSVAAQRPFFFDHIPALTDQCMQEFSQLTGRPYARVLTYRCEDAEYLIVGQGSVISNAEAVVDYLRETRGLKVGVVNLIMFRPFPGDLLSRILKGRKGVAVLERTDQPLAADLPLIREIRTSLAKCMENGRVTDAPLPHPSFEPYRSLEDAPPLYSGSFGMGSRDLQPEGLIGTVENMLPGGKQKKIFYLSIDFIREKPFTIEQDEYQKTIVEAYPQVKDLAIHGSENPNLMPKGCVTVRFHSVGGWGAITTGKNLAMTLFDLLGYHIKANPKYGSEKKGQPTTYYLAAAPEPIKINCEFYYVDVVLSPDPNVFRHTNALAGLKKGGTFVIQSDLDTPEKVWASIPAHYQKIIVDNGIRIFYIDAFKVAREEASDAELQFRMQGIAFQGSFFAASPVMQMANLSEEKLFQAIEQQLQHKFGSKGARVVEDNMRVVRRGFTEVHEIKDKPVGAQAESQGLGHTPPPPLMLSSLPISEDPKSDIHRFWEQTGNFYMRGMGNDTITDPFIGLSIMPAVTGLMRDMTGIRFEHPNWIPENCTACGNCYTVCPDTAIPGLVNDISQVCDTIVRSLEEKGETLTYLRKGVRSFEPRLRELIDAQTKTPKAKVDVGVLIGQAIKDTVAGAPDDQKGDAAREFGLFEHELGAYKFAVTRPYYVVPEKRNKNSGGLLSITVNPYTCKGCMECVSVCNDDALRPITQTAGSIARLKNEWEFWRKLPTTPKKFIRVDNLEECVGALETILLDKDAYMAVASGDGACMGCTEKTVLRLFCATIEALMQPRIARHVDKITDLIAKLEKHIQAKRSGGADGAAVQRAEVALAKLRDLHYKYTDGITGRGRAKLGMLNSTGCTSVWGSTYPFNPYPFPWSNHLFQDSSSVAMGIFEGHMVKMADGFRAVRIAELELEGKYEPAKHDEFFTYFNWQKFSDEEWLLCPPVVAVGGDGAMYDIGFQNVSRVLASGKPVKIMVVDTQVYSNTGGQACTSGFPGQISDMAQYGKAIQGKEELRKEIGLIGMAHRTTYVLQSGTNLPSHMIEGFIEGLMIKKPALFNIYCACQPEHGVADDAGKTQAKLAFESRAYPFFKYNPAKGQLPSECFNLDGNPSMDTDWHTYTLKYVEDGQEKSMQLPLTFADFALTEARFRKHFKRAPQDTWNDKMVPVADFLKLGAAERQGRVPYIWAVDKKNRLSRVLVAKPVIDACEDRLQFWRVLKALAGSGTQPAQIDREALVAQIRSEMAQKLAAGLVQLVSGGGSVPPAAPAPSAAPAAAAPVNGTAAKAQAAAGGFAKTPSLDSAGCTACGECIAINPAIFAYNADGKAYLKDPLAGPYKDIVKAAEKCGANVIRPGVPTDSSGDTAKWIQRAERFNA